MPEQTTDWTTIPCPCRFTDPESGRAVAELVFDANEGPRFTLLGEEGHTAIVLAVNAGGEFAAIDVNGLDGHNRASISTSQYGGSVALFTEPPEPGRSEDLRLALDAGPGPAGVVTFAQAWEPGTRPVGAVAVTVDERGALRVLPHQHLLDESEDPKPPPFTRAQLTALEQVIRREFKAALEQVIGEAKEEGRAA